MTDADRAAPTRAASPEMMPVAAASFEQGNAAYEAGLDEPPRPFATLAAGGILATVSLVLIVYIAYHTFFLKEVSDNAGIFWTGIAFFPLTTGVFLFSYGWERGDMGRALRLTMIVVVVSAVAFAAFGLLLSILAKAKGGEAAAGASGGSDAEGVPLQGPVRAVLSTLGDPREGAAADQARASSDLFTITCMRCNSAFVPIPPQAICPNCGWAAVTVA